MVNLVESFLSIQGEGKYSGTLAYFFRFAGCNLKCQGFNSRLKSPKTGEILIGCDTIRATYTNHFDYEKITDPNDLIDKIPNLNTKPVIVITGGEPLLHYKDEVFCEFISKLIGLNFEVHFETNGTIFVDFEKYKFYINCVFAISPKLSISGENREKRLNFKALENIKIHAKDSFYKFVISKEFSQNDEILEILAKAKNDVYCMPLAKNRAQLEQNAEFTAEFCIKNGYNYSDRLHIRIYDDKDGV